MHNNIAFLNISVVCIEAELLQWPTETHYCRSQRLPISHCLLHLPWINPQFALLSSLLSRWYGQIRSFVRYKLAGQPGSSDVRMHPNYWTTSVVFSSSKCFSSWVSSRRSGPPTSNIRVAKLLALRIFTPSSTLTTLLPLSHTPLACVV